MPLLGRRKGDREAQERAKAGCALPGWLQLVRCPDCGGRPRGNTCMSVAGRACLKQTHRTRPPPLPG